MNSSLMLRRFCCFNTSSSSSLNSCSKKKPLVFLGSPQVLSLSLSLSLSFLFSFGIWVCNEMGILVLYCRSLQQSLMPFSMHLLLQTLYFRYWTLNSHYIIFNSIFSFTFLSNIVTLLGFIYIYIYIIITIIIIICLVGVTRGLFHWDSYLKK